jgi:hypothetical protein
MAMPTPDVSFLNAKPDKIEHAYLQLKSEVYILLSQIHLNSVFTIPDI